MIASGILGVMIITVLQFTSIINSYKKKAIDSVKVQKFLDVRAFNLKLANARLQFAGSKVADNDLDKILGKLKSDGNPENSNAKVYALNPEIGKIDIENSKCYVVPPQGTVPTKCIFFGQVSQRTKTPQLLKTKVKYRKKVDGEEHSFYVYNLAD